MSGLRVGELFAGAGGIGMGVKAIWPDASVAWVSDIKPGACKVLAHRLPDAPNLGDITKIDWSQVEPVDIITGGSPCQDLSHAGKRMGMKKGTRSGLWASMLEGIAALNPSLVIWENVRGAFSAEADSAMEPCAGCLGIDDDTVVLRALGRVLGDLADIGYDAGWVGLRAADVGACHGRFRVFVLAWPADAERELGDEWRLAGPREASSGRASADDGGRGGALVGNLLPTPVTQPDTGNGHARNLGKEVRELLPTPAVNDMGAGKTVEHWDAWTDAMKSKHGNGNGHGKSLSIEAQRLAVLPTPTTMDSAASGGSPLGTNVTLTDAVVRLADTFKQYAPAIARHELMAGRPAPSPTEPTGRGGANRLSPAFTEWMMGWPAGWVTDVPGVTRNEALSICGDGVVPQQCEAAIRRLLDVRALATSSERVA